MRWMLALTMGAAMSAATMAVGQAPVSSNAAGAVFANEPGQLDTKAMLVARGKKLLEKAATSAEGSASETLNQYGGYYTLLVARVRSGVVEKHANYDDFFFMLEGDLTEVVGGEMQEPKSSGVGEMKAATMTGGTPNPLHAGDVLHVSANTPHQTMVPAGKTVIYYVIKASAKK